MKIYKKRQIAHFIARNLLVVIILFSFPNQGIADDRVQQNSQVGYQTYLPIISLQREAIGVLDPAFNGNGHLSVHISDGYDEADAVAIQTDGKIVVVGTTWTGSDNSLVLVRFNTDGSLDTTFGRDGIVVTYFADGIDTPSEVVVQPDGKILVAGTNYNGGSQIAEMARFNPDGSLDTTFGDYGRVMNDNIGATEMLLLRDGKILLAGTPDTAGIYLTLARYNPDGSLDNSFGFGIGWVSVGFTYQGWFNSIGMQADGKIVIVGWVNLDVCGSKDILLVRYNPDGSLDTTFDGDGIVTTDITVHDLARVVMYLWNGKIVVAGVIDAPFPILRSFVMVHYNQDGSLDTGFDGDGIVATNVYVNNSFNTFDFQSNGKVIIGGMGGGDNPDFVLSRFNPDASIDNSFGSDGMVTTDFYGRNDYGLDVALQSDDKIVMVGYAQNGSTEKFPEDFAIARYK